MTTTIETDIKEVLGEFKQEFFKLNQRLDRIESDLTSLKVSQAEMKGEISTVKNELTFIREDIKDLRGSQRSQIWVLIVTVVGAIIKFGFFPNP
jgi:predicted  nucleic acid-binding Zn-ribbon protein